MTYLDVISAKNRNQYIVRGTTVYGVIVVPRGVLTENYETSIHDFRYT